MKSGWEVAVWYAGIGFLCGAFFLAPLWAKALMIGVIMTVIVHSKVFTDPEADREREDFRGALQELVRVMQGRKVKREVNDASRDSG